MGATTDVIVDQRLREIQREYLEFLEDEEDTGIYAELVKDMVEKNESRLLVNINDLRKKNTDRAVGILNNAFDEVIAFQRALKEFTAAVDTNYAKGREEVFVGFEGSFGSKHLSPRTLSARHLGNLVCVEGIVTKCSLIHPKVVRSVHYCPTTKKTMERRYTDMTSYEPFPTTSIYPTKDDDGNLLETEYGLSTYKDHQTLSIQEMPEKAPAGQLPRSVDIIADNDLVDQCKPGDRVQIVGIYRCLPNKQQSFTSGTFRTILLANNIIQMSKEISPNIFTEDVIKCKRLSRDKNIDIFELLSKSLAPSIHGHEYIKKALLCMLLGGVEKVLPNGTRLRGDINILLIGDPSVAKSQLLRYVLNTAPRAIATTGRGSSGVGLTAAVTTDHETGDRRLEAGAMVLGDRGVVCIDEFDKMSDIDRTAIHEVMEQGRVTISKAGIHARLNARCSVLAAANPVYGRYDQYKTPMENIGLQDSLLSRFDCLFIMLDIADNDADRMISEHVVRMHRYRNPQQQDGEVLSFGLGVDRLSTQDPNKDKENDEETETQIYEKYDALLHGKLRNVNDKILSMEFMRKYIHIAKVIKPVLTKPASDCIAEEYSRLRSHDSENNNMARTQPVTARALETLIRLSTAHAKARLSKQVTTADAEAAIELVQFAYFKRVLEKKKKRKEKKEGEEESEMDTEGEDGGDDESPKRRKRKQSTDGSKEKVKRPKKKPGEEGYDPYEIGSSDSENEASTPASLSKKASRLSISDDQPPKKARTSKTPKKTPTSRKSKTPQKGSKTPQKSVETPKEISETRFKIFKNLIHQFLKKNHAQSFQRSEAVSYINENASEEFQTSEIDAALEKMSEANQIMIADDDMIFLI